MGPEGVPSGESHLRLRRESDGKFLIFRLYSVGLGGRDFIWCRVFFFLFYSKLTKLIIQKRPTPRGVFWASALSSSMHG